MQKNLITNSSSEKTHRTPVLHPSLIMCRRYFYFLMLTHESRQITGVDLIHAAGAGSQAPCGPGIARKLEEETPCAIRECKYLFHKPSTSKSPKSLIITSFTSNHSHICTAV